MPEDAYDLYASGLGKGDTFTQVPTSEEEQLAQDLRARWRAAYPHVDTFILDFMMRVYEAAKPEIDKAVLDAVVYGSAAMKGTWVHDSFGVDLAKEAPSTIWVEELADWDLAGEFFDLSHLPASFTPFTLERQPKPIPHWQTLNGSGQPWKVKKGKRR